MIIGVTGYARHGKDSVGEILCRRFGFHSMALADPLKKAAEVMFGWGRDHLYGTLKETVDPRWGISPRRAMQLLGTEFGQFALMREPGFAAVTGRKLWVRRLLELAEGDVVVTDVRFPHEAEELRRHGARIFRVVRPGVSACAEHASESEQVGISPDWTVINSGTLEDLEREVCALMEAK